MADDEVLLAPVPPRRDVAVYVSDMTGQLAAMAQGAGLAALARALDQAHELARASVDALDLTR